MKYTLLQLHTDLLEEIASFCNIIDLKNLSCCSHASNDVFREYLWHTICIPIRQFWQNDFRNVTRLEEYLNYTKVLHISGSTSFITVDTNEKFSRNFAAVFNSFDNLLELHIPGTALKSGVISTICNSVKDLKLFNVTSNVYIRDVDRDVDVESKMTDTDLSHLATMVTIQNYDLIWT